MDYMFAVNTVFCVLIVIFGIRRWRTTGAKAFFFIAFAYTLFGLSHFALGIGLDYLKPTLTAARTVGYFLIIIGLAI